MNRNRELEVTVAKRNGKAGERRNKSASASVLTQKDADRFQKSALAWGRKATKTKKTARRTLVSLGISTKSGRLTKKYG